VSEVGGGGVATESLGTVAGVWCSEDAGSHGGVGCER
jgi:hypothetical protein